MYFGRETDNSWCGHPNYTNHASARISRGRFARPGPIAHAQELTPAESAQQLVSEVPVTNLQLVLMRTIKFGGLSHKAEHIAHRRGLSASAITEVQADRFLCSAEIVQVGYDHAWLNRSR
jgi:hypothetical protein